MSIDPRLIWMQTVYKENGEVIALFRVNVNNISNPEANNGHIYVKDMSNGNIVKYDAYKIQSENGEDIYKATYTPKAGQDTKIKMAVTIHLASGEEKEYFDTNNGYWYQA